MTNQKGGIFTNTSLLRLCCLSYLRLTTWAFT